MFPSCDYHTHPQGHIVRPYSIDLLQPWIDQCRLKGIQSIAFTDHDRYIEGIDFDVIDRLRDLNPEVEVLAGIELDNDPVTSTNGLRWVEKHWEQLDFVLGSVHYFSGESEMLDRAGETDQIETCRRLLATGKAILLPGDLTVLSPDGAFGPGRHLLREPRDPQAGRPFDHAVVGSQFAFEQLEQG